MERCKYLVIGGGRAGDAAVRGIREADRNGSILVVSDEPDPPYDRPPLSKALWKGSGVETIWRHTDQAGAELRLGARIVAINRNAKTAIHANGAAIAYDRLLLATGGTPRRLRGSAASTIYYRKLSDFKRAREAASHGAEFAVIGGGFIGSEIAAALAMNGCRVSMIFPGQSICDRVFPRPLANFLNSYFRRRGVDVRLNERAELVERGSNKLVVRTNGPEALTVDAVIAGIGIKPNVDLAVAAGLNVADGILVDERLRTSDPDIFAAGDVASFPCLALNRRLRLEHEDNADAMGRTAGRNMAGGNETYGHLPSFYSDLFDFSYQAVGEVHSGMQIVADWVEKFYKGVIYYLRDERVIGVLLWNMWGLVDEARELIISGRTGGPASLIGRLREHEQSRLTQRPPSPVRPW
jgi:NADPH-dependent 2,4-dienoyl-CoA reductase/sulfur reductase-like enzyme